ncbi:DUF1501 domain-containing protein [Nonlabens ulvanivorans]|uniref:Twin-arginine translocation pathway signal n=1 Tax=Nonlabens ulvanivorans TaxID=906888 RepID=A0A084JZ99_NONUL|nr:DUF1501 domain-containing protein [Nonlabens ulvanivorans]KEZ94283.1 twin-arginine translocation pathway signal [Nonlabens ulvanivorans]PRX13276.1 uncharacterized protein (DUF1501 family) [Nonlabens ulvanivorans]
MQRRDFLKRSALASSAIMIPSFMRAFENAPASISGFKKLVVIQLSGGNDGLNTIVPYRNDIYYSSRPQIAIPENKILKATDDLGFNKHLAPLKELYDKGYLSIINNVGYPNPNRSHFRSTDIWHSASDATQYLESGWLGRYIEKVGTQSHLGIEVDENLSMILKGENRNGIATQNAALFRRNMEQPFFSEVLHQKTDTHLSEHNLGYLYKTMLAAKSSARYLHEKTRVYESKQEYPNNPFAKQLKTTAQFINSGVETQVYYVSMGGFDTHVNQQNSQGKLLATYSNAMSSFIKDLEKNDTFKDTLVMTFSEFGRRVAQNASNGTDHGTANQVYIMGGNLKKAGFYNPAANLSQLDDNGDMKFEIDFRTVYATILDRWMDVDDATVLNKEFSKLDFV